MKKNFTCWRKESEQDGVCFDLESSIELEVLEGNSCFIVMDESERRLYKVEAETAEAAVRRYIDWCYGMVRLWKYDETEKGYCESDTFVKAGEQYDLQEYEEHWELVED